MRFVGRCEELLKTGKFAIEGNYVASKFIIALAGARKEDPGARMALFEYLLDLHCRQNCIRRCFVLKQSPCTMTIANGNARKVLSLKNWPSVIDCWETGVKITRFQLRSLTKCKKENNYEFSEKHWDGYIFINLYRVDPEIIMSDQMLLQRNKSSQEKKLNFKGALQTSYVKENHSLQRERITAMTSLTSEQLSSAPELEFVFKGTGKRVKLNP